MHRQKEKVAAIILAAGRSARMGQTKQLLPFSDKPLLWQVVETALKAPVARVVVVLGYQADQIQTALQDRIQGQPRVMVVYNPRFDEGMSSSIIIGLSAVEKRHDHVMILLGDMPFIRTEVIHLLLARYLSSGMPIGAMVSETGLGHPVIFSRALYPELKHLRGDVGGKPILDKYPQRICRVAPRRFYDNRDIDTASDYAKARETEP